MALTWAGHEFLAAVRNDTACARIQARLAECASSQQPARGERADDEKDQSAIGGDVDCKQDEARPGERPHAARPAAYFLQRLDDPITIERFQHGINSP
ncbi:MAG: hypothetical protein ACK4SR_13690 [Thiobacillus sp.]